MLNTGLEQALPHKRLRAYIGQKLGQHGPMKAHTRDLWAYLDQVT